MADKLFRIYDGKTAVGTVTLDGNAIDIGFIDGDPVHLANVYPIGDARLAEFIKDHLKRLGYADPRLQDISGDHTSTP